MYNQDVNSLTDFWDWGNGLTGVGFEPCATYDSPGDYTVTQTDTIVGWQTTCINSQTATVHVQQAPFSTFTFTSPTPTDVDFTSTATNGTSYSWDFGDTNTSTLEDPTHTYGAAGTYEVWFYVYNECGVDSSSQAVFITVGQEELELDALIEVFPNPSNGEFQVQIVGNETLQLQVFNAVGQQVHETTLGLENEVDLSSQAPGIYWLRFTSGSATATKQVQVIR
jgi:PKD repeat protein